MPLLFYPVLLIALAAAYTAGRIFGTTPLRRTFNARRHYRVLLVAIVLAWIGAVVAVPDLSNCNCSISSSSA